MEATRSRFAPALYVLGLATMALVVSLSLFEAFELIKGTHEIAGTVGGHLKLDSIQTKLVQAALLWISSIVVLICFYLKEGTTLWQHVARNKCFNVERYVWRLIFCATPRVAATILFAPMIIGAGVVKSMFSKAKLVDVGFVTLNPHYLFTMTKHLIAATAFFCLVFGATHAMPF